MTAKTAPGIIDRLVERAAELYTLPIVAMEVVRLTAKPEVDAETLCRHIEQDPALAAKILRVVNSSLYVGNGEIADLQQALAMLGTVPLKFLVLGFSLPDELLTDLEEEVLERYWKHTLVKASAARHISQRLFCQSGDEAFLAGLLQDLGMLVLIQELGDSYVDFFDRILIEGRDLQELELSTLGFDHVMLSARLLGKWGLPADLVAAIATPHEEGLIAGLEEPRRSLVQTLHLAELLAQLLVHARSDILERLLQVGENYCGLDVPQLEQIVSALQESVPALAGCLQISLSQHHEFREVLQSAHRQLSAMAEGVCGDWLSRRAALSTPGELPQLRVCEVLEDGPPLTRPAPRGPAPATGLQKPSKDDRGEDHRASASSETADPSLHVRLDLAVKACRQARRPVSLLIVELDELGALLFLRGSEGARRCVARLRMVLEQVHGDQRHVLALDEGRFAVILEGLDRQPAVEFARQVIQRVRDWSFEDPVCRAAFSASAGLATLAMPPRNFPAPELVVAAERCLAGVQLSGGDGVKSIELY